jgi:hypothetical protein
MQIEMKSWTCYKQGKSKTSNSIVWTIASSQLPLIVNNTSSSLVAMEPQRKPILNYWF